MDNFLLHLQDEIERWSSGNAELANPGRLCLLAA